MKRSEFLDKLSKLTKEQINTIIKENGKKKKAMAREVPLPFTFIDVVNK